MYIVNYTFRFSSSSMILVLQKTFINWVIPWKALHNSNYFCDILHAKDFVLQIQCKCNPPSPPVFPFCIRGEIIKKNIYTCTRTLLYFCIKEYIKMFYSIYIPSFFLANMNDWKWLNRSISNSRKRRKTDKAS